ncbi:hypothetical protein [Streptomyces sp. NPDC086989]|uniref:hypothetical protein n=1 Tax=Streptomyces sp. NPDC086989 TaxID=3365764 RepID=UPI003808C843
MTHLTLIQAETEEAWYERDNLQTLKAKAAELEARIEVIEFKQTVFDPPQAA